MAVNTTLLDGLADSQFRLEISTDGTVYKKVELLLDLDMPEEVRVTDDITPTDAHNTHKVAVNFFEANDLNFEMVFNPDDVQHKAILSAYRMNKVIHCKILFEDTRLEGFSFIGTLTKLTPVADPQKKLRYNGTILIGSDINDTVKSGA